MANGTLSTRASVRAMRVLPLPVEPISSTLLLSNSIRDASSAVAPPAALGSFSSASCAARSLCTALSRL